MGSGAARREPAERHDHPRSQDRRDRRDRPADVFVFIGLSPNSDLVRGLVATDSQGFILTDAAMQTDVPGLFAAGDVRRLDLSLSPTDERKPAQGRFVTGKYFSILRVNPLLGRTFSEQEADIYHPAPVAVKS